MSDWRHLAWQEAEGRREEVLTQVAGYQNPGAFHPEMSAIANDKLAVALRVTTILTQLSLSV
jgi:hypothetical protein